MSVFTSSIEVAAPPEAVFDYVAERSNELEWNPQCKAVESLTPGPIGVGSRWRAQWKGSPVIEVETTGYDRPRSITNHNGGPLEITVTFACTPQGAGTRLDVRFEATPHGMMRLLFPLFARRFGNEVPHNLARVKAAVETAARRHTGASS